MEHFGYTEADFIPCEVCGAKGVDIHHIENRKMGGNPKGDKNSIHNLMSLCRDHHLRYGDKSDFKEWLKEIHLNFMKSHAR